MGLASPNAPIVISDLVEKAGKAVVGARGIVYKLKKLIAMSRKRIISSSESSSGEEVKFIPSPLPSRISRTARKLSFSEDDSEVSVLQKSQSSSRYRAHRGEKKEDHKASLFSFSYLKKERSSSTSNSRPRSSGSTSRSTTVTGKERPKSKDNVDTKDPKILKVTTKKEVKVRDKPKPVKFKVESESESEERDRKSERDRKCEREHVQKKSTSERERDRKREREHVQKKSTSERERDRERERYRDREYVQKKSTSERERYRDREHIQKKSTSERERDREHIQKKSIPKPRQFNSPPPVQRDKRPGVKRRLDLDEKQEVPLPPRMLPEIREVKVELERLDRSISSGGRIRRSSTPSTAVEIEVVDVDTEVKTEPEVEVAENLGDGETTESMELDLVAEVEVKTEDNSMEVLLDTDGFEYNTLTNSSVTGNRVKVRKTEFESSCIKFIEQTETIPYAEAYPGVGSVSFDATNNNVTGYVNISPRTVKPLQMTGDASFIYWILDGEVVVKSSAVVEVAGKNYLYGKTLAKGSCIMVPPRTAYTLENRSQNQNVVIGFVLIKQS